MRVKELICTNARRALNRMRRFLDRCERREPIAHDSKINSHSCQVLLLACRSRNRALDDARRLKERGDSVFVCVDTISAIMLATAATEAFINDMAEIIGVCRQNAADFMGDSLTHELCVCADAIFDAEFAREGTPQKYFVASKALGLPFDRGCDPFQSFAKLIALRNEVVHIKASRADGKHAGVSVTKELAQRGLTVKVPLGELPWFDQIQSPQMAVWACKSAIDLIFAMLEKAAPHGDSFVLGGTYKHFHGQGGLVRDRLASERTACLYPAAPFSLPVNQ
jgi:hypothetical protein